MTRKSTALVLTLSLAILLTAHAHGADEVPSLGWTPEAMLRVKQVGGVQVSPDSEMVAYVVRRAVIEAERNEFVSRIHVANRDGTGGYPLSQAEHSSDGPQWSPDGQTI